MFVANSSSFHWYRQFEAKYWKHTHRKPTPEESKDIFDKGGGHGFSSWFYGLVLYPIQICLHYQHLSIISRSKLLMLNL